MVQKCLFQQLEREAVLEHGFSVVVGAMGCGSSTVIAPGCQYAPSESPHQSRNNSRLVTTILLRALGTVKGTALASQLSMSHSKQ